MKILLVNPARYMKDSYMFPPIHLLYIAQAVRRTGHEAEIVDIPYLINTQPEQFNINDDSGIDYVLSKNFDILGIGSVVSSYSYCERLVKKVRGKRAGIPIIIGGSVGLPVKDIWAEYAPVDYICESDGELVVEKFMTYFPHDMESVKSIPGLHYLDESGRYVGNKPNLPMNLDYIPFLTYDEVDLEYYVENQRNWIKKVLCGMEYSFNENERFLPLIMSRGCVYKCTFCFHFNSLHRKHSPKYIADYVEFMMDRYGATAFQIIDDLILINKQWLHEVCDEIIKRGIKTKFFSSGGKPSVVDREILMKMKEAGFKRISYGIESGSQTILDIMKKQTTVADNFKAVSLMKEVGIPCTVNIVFGMPGETEKTMNETRDFLISLELTSRNYYAALATPYPGSPLFQQIMDKGIIRDTREYLFNLGGYGDYKYNLTGMPRQKFLNKVLRIAYNVDCAHYKKRKQYRKRLSLIVETYIRMLYYIIPYDIRSKLGIGSRITTLKKVIAVRKLGRIAASPGRRQTEVK